MLQWLKTKLGYPEARDRSIEERFKQLWQDLVPLSGEAETLQGELVRSVGRLEDEFSRNGNVNWEAGGYHCEFVEFLKRHLADLDTFGAPLSARLRDAAELVRKAAEDITIEKDGDDEIIVTKHDPAEALEFLIEMTVEWCEKHPTPIYKTQGQDFWIAKG
jgi:hypothetical protein